MIGPQTLPVLGCRDELGNDLSKGDADQEVQGTVGDSCGEQVG